MHNKLKAYFLALNILLLISSLALAQVKPNSVLNERVYDCVVNGPVEYFEGAEVKVNLTNKEYCCPHPMSDRPMYNFYFKITVLNPGKNILVARLPRFDYVYMKYHNSGNVRGDGPAMAWNYDEPNKSVRIFPGKSHEFMVSTTAVSSNYYPTNAAEYDKMIQEMPSAFDPFSLRVHLAKAIINLEKNEEHREDNEEDDFEDLVSELEQSLDNAINEEPVYTFVETMPIYPGGMEKFVQWCKQGYQYRISAKGKELVNNIEANFIVETDGSLSNIDLSNNINYDIAFEFKQLLEDSPNWQPGIQRGTPVRVKQVVSIPLKSNLKPKSNDITGVYEKKEFCGDNPNEMDTCIFAVVIRKDGTYINIKGVYDMNKQGPSRSCPGFTPYYAYNITKREGIWEMVEGGILFDKENKWEIVNNILAPGTGLEKVNHSVAQDWNCD